MDNSRLKKKKGEKKQIFLYYNNWSPAEAISNFTYIRENYNLKVLLIISNQLVKFIKGKLCASTCKQQQYYS